MKKQHTHTNTAETGVFHTDQPWAPKEAQAVIAAYPDYLFWKDQQSRYLGCNQAFAHLVGLSHPTDIVGLSDYALPWQPQGHRADFFRAGDQATLSGTATITRQREVLALPNEPARLVQVTKRPLKEANNDICGVLGVAWDITPECQDLATLEALLAESDQLHADQQAWIRHLNHGLRTPLLTLMAMQSLLASALSDTPYADSLALLNTARQQLHHRIHQLHTLTTPPTDHPPTCPMFEDFSPDQRMTELVETMSVYAEKKGLTLSHQAEVGLPKRLKGPDTVITSVCIELLYNALQFTDQGHIQLTQTYRNDQWVITVRDTGRGVSQTDQTRITQPFVTVIPATQDPEARLGLGLTQVQQALASVGATLSIQSVLGQGSTMTVCCPAQTSVPSPSSEVAPLKQEDPPLKPGIQVLVVEDNALARLSMKQLLKHHGASVVTYDCAEEVWAQPLDPTIHLVITDIGLPGASGLDLAAWILKQPSPPPIFAVSAHLDQALKQDCQATGLQGAYTKPLTTAQVKTLLSQARLARASTSGNP